MVNKRKQGLTQARAKLTSHRMRSATVGTHVPRRSSRHMNGEAVGFSSPRKRKRAARGIVETILPVTSSGESSSQYARRVSRREFAQDIQRKARIRRIVAGPHRQIAFRQSQERGRDHPPPGIPVISAPGTKLLERKSRHSGLLLKLSGRTLIKILLELHKASRRGIPANAWMIAPFDKKKL